VAASSRRRRYRHGRLPFVRRVLQRDGAEAEQQQPGGDGEQAGVVVTGRPDLDRVVHSFEPGDDAERAGEQRERAPAAAA
jgi:hypothetical protein